MEPYQTVCGSGCRNLNAATPGSFAEVEIPYQ
jgi:hypothetical protein